MAKGRVRLPDDLSGLLRSEWDQILEQANLGAEDTLIARRCLVDKIPQIDVAEDIGIHRSTISHRLPRIIARAQQVKIRLNIP